GRRGAGEPAIDRQPLAHVGDVLLVDSKIELQIHRGAARIGDLLSFDLLDRLLEQLHVRLEADGVDVSALLAAKQVTGAANLEIERGDAEAAAEIAELADRR